MEGINISLQYGQDSTRISIKHEPVAYGTASGNAVWIGRVQECTPDESEGTFEERFAGGGTRQVQNFIPGPTTRNIKIQVHPQDWRLFGYALGAVTESGTYQHTCVDLTNTGTVPSFSLQRGLAGAANRTEDYAGCVINSMELSVEQKEEVKLDLDTIGKSVTPGTSAPWTVTSGTKVNYNWSDVRGLYISGTALGLYGFITELKSFKAKVEKGLTADHYLTGGRDIAKPKLGNATYTMDATADMTEGTGGKLIDIQRNGSEFNADFWVCRAGSAVPAVSGNDYLHIWATGCIIQKPGNYPNPLEGVIEQGFTIRPRIMNAITSDEVTTYLS